MDSNKYFIVGFDEPDNKIHPTFWKEIYIKALKSKANIMITTTNLFTVENFLVYKKPKIYFFEQQSLSNTSITNIREIEVVDTQIPISDFGEDQNIKVARKYLDFDYKSLKNILPIKKYVFVEGTSDLDFLLLLFNDMKYKDIEVVSLAGQDKIISKEYLKPILDFILLIQNYSPNIYCIFDFDSEGFKYASHFENIISKNNIFFINGEKYSNYVSSWNDKFEKFTLENLLHNQYIKEREYAALSNKTIKSKLIKRLDSYENNDFKFNSEQFKSQFINKFEDFLNEYFIEDGSPKVSKVKSIKNKSKNLFHLKNGVKKINYNNFNRVRLNKLKKTIGEKLGEVEKPYQFINKKYTPTQISEINELKKTLKIPDYVLKVNSKSIFYYKDYNYFKFNHASNEGVISNEILKLLKLLDEHSEYQIEESYYTLDEINGNKFEVSGLMLNNKEIIENINTHKGVYIKLCKKLYEIDREKIKSCINDNVFNGRSNRHFASRIEEIAHDPCEIAEGLWIETQFSSTAIYNKIRLLLKLYNFENDWFRIKINM